MNQESRYNINGHTKLTSEEFRQIISDINEIKEFDKKKTKTHRCKTVLVKRATEIAKSYGYTLTEMVSLLHDRKHRGTECQQNSNMNQEIQSVLKSTSEK
jgi:hypothetical protein